MDAKGVFEKWFAGSTGDPPVPSGDSPDGTKRTVRANRHGFFATLPAAVPVGGSPTGAGGSPAPPIFKTGSNRFWSHRMGRFHTISADECFGSCSLSPREPQGRGGAHLDTATSGENE